MTLIPRSITGRLVCWFFFSTAVVLMGIGLYLNAKVEEIVVSSVDRTLHSKLQIITGLMHEEHGTVELELSEIIAGDYVIPRSGHYYRVLMDNAVLAASPSLADDNFEFGPPPASDNQAEESIITSTGPGGEPVRVLRHRFAAFGRTFDITLAESLGESLDTISQLRHVLFLAIPLGIVLLSLTAWWIAKRSLRPLAAFSAKIETITETNLTERIDATMTAQELAGLARSFNAMLDRLLHVFEGQKRLVADASHELKTPVSVIKTQCDVVLQRWRTPEEYVDALRTITSVSQEMTRLINDLLSLARIDGGLLSPATFSSVSLGECIEYVVQMTEPLARERNVHVTATVDDTLCVMGSRTALAEAFLNLIENGVRYNREGGTVAITAEDQDGKAAITISDTGVGIKGSDRERIFESFYRADTVRGTDGTGLGLSIVKSVVEAHGGSIAVESDPGVGSRFIVILPRAGW